MRNLMTFDWARGLQGAIEKMVRGAFPGDLRTWPLLQTFNFEAYSIEDKYLVLVLQDKLSGMMSGPGVPRPFPHTDHPGLPLRAGDAAVWQTYLNRRFDLRPEDAAIIVPAKDSGRGALEDFGLFSADERVLWADQLRMIVSRQKIHMNQGRPAPSVHLTVSPPVHNTYNVSGPNARVLVNSHDESTNIVQTQPAEVFGAIRDLISSAIEKSARDALMNAVREMEEAQGSTRFASTYKKFIALAADHMTILAPVLPALAQLLG